MYRRFEFIEGRSAKFYEVCVNGCEVTACYGRIGADGQTLTKSIPDHAKAQQHADKLVSQKLAKGYVECVVR